VKRQKRWRKEKQGQEDGDRHKAGRRWLQLQSFSARVDVSPEAARPRPTFFKPVHSAG